MNDRCDERSVRIDAGRHAMREVHAIDRWRPIDELSLFAMENTSSLK